MEDLDEGDCTTITAKLRSDVVDLYSNSDPKARPLLVRPNEGQSTRLGRHIIRGLFAATLVSSAVRRAIDGSGATCVWQTTRFLRPVFPHDKLTARATITENDVERGRMVLTTVCRNQAGQAVLSGTAEVRCRQRARSFGRQLVATLAAALAA